MKIGIMGAMPEEVSLLAELLTDHKEHEIGGRNYHSGKIGDHDIILVFSRWGKVASASTATTLINIFGIDSMIFTGVAGAIEPTLKVGDVVIGDEFYQHDMDTRPIFDRFQIPLTNKLSFKADTVLCDKAVNATEKYLKFSGKEELSSLLLNKFRINKPRVVRGNIASGDQFISSSEKQEELKNAIPNLQAVEMEGAAVAQVCDDNKVPFVVIRTISDSADHNAHVDFNAFIATVANQYSRGIVQEIVRSM